MHLVHMGLVNWHLFPLLDISLSGPVLGISGENKAGKSTLLDAIQTVMTGCDQAQMDLNRVAAEKGSRGTHRRSVQAYCLGRLSSDDVRRQASNSCILVVFRDPEGKKPSTTLGVALEAKISDNSVIVSSRFMAIGYELKASDIVVAGEGGTVIAQPWGDNRRRIQALVEAAGGEFHEYRDTAREFVREYTYKLFAHGRLSVPGQYIRNLINAITFKEMASADEFVSTYLLEKKPIQVASLRRSIQVYRDAAQQVEELSRNLEALKVLLAHLDELRGERETHARESWIALRAKISSAVTMHNAKRREAAALTAKLNDKERQESQCESETGRIRDELEGARARRRTALSADRQDSLKKDLELLDRSYAEVRRPIFGSNGGGALITGFARVAAVPGIAETLGEQLLELVREALTLLPSGIDRREAPDAPERLDAICQRMGDMLLSIADATQRRHLAALAAVEKLQEEQSEQRRILDETKAGRLTVSPQVEAMMRRLRQAGMAPRVLAEMVDIRDDDWRNAAEGFLGADREAIFVEPAHCHAAIDIRYAERGAFRGVRVANTRKLGRMNSRPERDTLASVFASSDPLAMAYVVHRTGRVWLATSKLDFDRDGRWILRDGTYDDGVAIDVKEAGILKIGSQGLASTASAAAARLTEVEDELKAAQAARQIAERIDLSVKALQSWLADNRGADSMFSAFATASARMAELALQRGDIEEEIGRLASADVSAIDKEIAQLDGHMNDAIQEREGLKSEIKDLGGKLGAVRGTLNSGSQTPGSWQHAKITRDICRSRMRHHVVLDPIRAYVARRAESKSVAALEKSASEVADAAKEQISELELICADKARECLAALKQNDLFGQRPQLEGEIRPWAQEQVDEIENESLVGYRRDLEEARNKTNDIFRNSFVNELIARFAGVDEELREIREVLKRYDFLNERYNFRSSRAPGYEAFHRIVDRQKEIELAGGNLQLFKGSIDDENPFAEDMRAVENVLLAEDVDIEMYEDYRRYFKFELEITDVASGRTVAWSVRKGTASGGETQTPYYVALLSALSSIYYGGARARNGREAGGLCLAAFDEAFSKLDEKVRLQMVEFSQDLGLQLLICGPDGGRRSMERYAHSIVDVWRVGDQSFAVSDLIKERTRQELAAIDPARLSREEIEQILLAAE